jgi:hypothetical protein
MAVFNRLIAALAMLLTTPGHGRAENPDAPIWCQWETEEVERLGPEKASGALFYFHGYRASMDNTAAPIPHVFAAMAKAAKWDLVRVNRRREADLEADDGRILDVVARHVAQARREGYKHIVMAGWSRRGWLALTAATLDQVDAVIGIAPGVHGISTEGLEGSRDRLAQRLQQAKARRMAAFFFDGDWLEDVPERRAVVIRRALQRTSSTFMVVDRPFDLYGHGGGQSGAFDKKYRDCLVWFAQAQEELPGEARCPFGDQLAMPTPAAYGDGALAAYWGLWEGVDDSKAWITMRSLKLYREWEGITFELVHSPRAGTGFELVTGLHGFQFDVPRKRIYAQLDNRSGRLIARLKSTEELELKVSGARIPESSVVLRRRTAATEDPARQP